MTSMTMKKICHDESKVLQIIKNNYSVTDETLCDIIKSYGEDLRLSVYLGFPISAIANEIYHRWVSE